MGDDEDVFFDCFREPGFERLVKPRHHVKERFAVGRRDKPCVLRPGEVRVAKLGDDSLLVARFPVAEFGFGESVARLDFVGGQPRDYRRGFDCAVAGRADDAVEFDVRKPVAHTPRLLAPRLVHADVGRPLVAANPIPVRLAVSRYVKHRGIIEKRGWLRKR